MFLGFSLIEFQQDIFNMSIILNVLLAVRVVDKIFRKQIFYFYSKLLYVQEGSVAERSKALV